ncbi:MAG: erythromycin esterase family protein [Elusimicrobiota bacterium]
MIRFLVEEEGFRGVMFESPWGDAERTAQYVLTCRDSPEAAMEGLFEVWHSESVRDLLRWLCEFNQKHPKDPVRFAGFDVQQPWHDWQVLRDFLESIKDSSKEKLMGGISACPGVGMMSYEEAMASGLRDKPYPRDQRRRCRNGLRAIHRRLQDIRGDPAQAKADALLETAELSLEGLGVWQDVLHYGRSLLGFHKAFDLRDRAMANTLVKLRKSKLKEARTVVWAANGHIGRGRKKFFGGLIRVKPMGAHLADKLGKKYVPVGLISYETEINWGGKSNPPVHAEPDSIEFILHGVGRPFLLVDLPLAEGKRGFLKPGRKYAVDYVRIVPIRHFQGLVFLDHSAPRRLIE